MALLPYVAFAERTVSNAQIVGTGAPGTSIPEGTSPNFGSIVEVISAAANDQESWGIWVFININQNPSATASGACMDILAGDSGSEEVIIPGLLVGGAYGTAARAFYFPLLIPPGTRISARVATEVSHASNPSVLVELYGGGVPPHPVGDKVITYGTKVNNARGQAVTPAASGGAASATQLTAATSRDHFYLLPSFQVEVDTTISTQTFNNVGIGVGTGSGDRAGTWWFGKDALERQSGPFPQRGSYRRTPAGSRLVLLASNGGANDTNYGALIHAI